jgi:anaerobic selenocysteine-containing dehydrogenase
MFRAVEDGTIKAIWIMATNPAASMPEAGRVRAALEKCPLVVVSDCIGITDTARYAHIRLPASACLVRAHSGRIALESETGRGSTFTVHLPRRPPGGR